MWAGTTPATQKFRKCVIRNGDGVTHVLLRRLGQVLAIYNKGSLRSSLELLLVTKQTFWGLLNFSIRAKNLGGVFYAEN